MAASVEVDELVQVEERVAEGGKALVARADEGGRFLPFDRVWLATDLDREGEAIAWHVADVIATAKDKLRRVTFHEITPSAIADAFKKPREIEDVESAFRQLDAAVVGQHHVDVDVQVAERARQAGRRFGEPSHPSESIP